MSTNAYGDTSLDQMSRDLLDHQRDLAARVAELRRQIAAADSQRRDVDKRRAERAR